LLGFIQVLYPLHVDYRLSWDLFILVFFGIVIAYSLIIGRNATLKVVIASYMAIFTADGLGNVFQLYLLPSAPTLQGESGEQALVLLKIFTFVLAIVVLAIRGGFRVDILPESSVVTRILSNLSFGFLNAGLMVSTFLVYLMGGSFVLGSTNLATTTNLYLESELIRFMVDNQSIWFALPAIAIVVVSFVEPRAE
jgi:hypothetical protein